MGFVIRTSPEQLRQRLMEYHDQLIANMTEAFIMACTEAVNRARSTDTYKDRTNNLRSSIGFALYYDGRMIHQDFATNGTGTGGGGAVSFITKEGKEISFNASSSGDTSGQKGMLIGEILSNKVAQQYTSGFVAVIVAGMHYALYVEAKGYDVLTGSTLDIRADLQKYFDVINSQYGTRYQAI
jgi:hypothetical protein